MKRVLIAAMAAALIGSACSDDNPTTPSDSVPPMFTAQLLPSNEVPPVANAEQSGSGAVTVTLNITRNASQTITAATADFQVTLVGFPNGTALSAAHIHRARPGSNGPTINNLALTAGEFVVPASGTVTFTKNNIAFNSLDDVTNMLNDPAGFYFNVHSTVNPGGVARGQLVRIQ